MSPTPKLRPAQNAIRVAEMKRPPEAGLNAQRTTGWIASTMSTTSNSDPVALVLIINASGSPFAGCERHFSLVSTSAGLVGIAELRTGDACEPVEQAAWLQPAIRMTRSTRQAAFRQGETAVASVRF